MPSTSQATPAGFAAEYEKAAMAGESAVVITISGKLDGKTLRFAVENTYQQPVLQDKDGTYQSSKYDGPGAGLKVVQSIAKRYAGSVKIDHTNGIFQVNVTLNP